MILSRHITTKIIFLFDQLVPPIVRDSKIFMYIPFRLLFGKRYVNMFFEFKDKAPFMTEEEYNRTYADINRDLIKRKTDLNDECVEEILDNLTGISVLEVGCGKAYLSNKMGKKGYDVTGVDIYIAEATIEEHKKIKFMKENIESLSFEDRSFDTVVCAHTLEHVQDLQKSISELRRVARKRLIIVVPKQRPYRYTFDPHLHFFPYLHSFLQVMRPRNRHVCKVVDMDIFYMEDTETTGE
ncbi:MAG: methyltransferase domain-containing protein [Candidatus Altiarchaeales archaeon]|nr:methyltransferase domain-containing protein [Candidatus Altiarchaeales archaeon]MBD3416638.1 methyltransferase domain-containing protein [Candidatus Altiarchaeales archaeon]